MSQAIYQVILSFICSLGFSVLYHIRGIKVLLSGLGGACSWGLFLALEPVLPSEPLRYFFCAAFVAVFAEILARKLKTPATTFLIPPIIPHIPGSALYHTMRYAIGKEWDACLAEAFHTLKLALALALGILAVLSILSVINQILSRFHGMEPGK